jgi:hypothetical protein
MVLTAGCGSLWSSSKTGRLEATPALIPHLTRMRSLLSWLYRVVGSCP